MIAFCVQGVMARVYEAVVLLLLLALLVLGIVWVASALLHDNKARKSLYGESPAASKGLSVRILMSLYMFLNSCLCSLSLNSRPVGVLPPLPVLGHLSLWSVASPV